MIRTWNQWNRNITACGKEENKDVFSHNNQVLIVHTLMSLCSADDNQQTTTFRRFSSRRNGLTATRPLVDTAGGGTGPTAHYTGFTMIQESGNNVHLPVGVAVLQQRREPPQRVHKASL